MRYTKLSRDGDGLVALGQRDDRSNSIHYCLATRKVLRTWIATLRHLQRLRKYLGEDYLLTSASTFNARRAGVASPAAISINVHSANHRLMAGGLALHSGIIRQMPPPLKKRRKETAVGKGTLLLIHASEEIGQPRSRRSNNNELLSINTLYI